jgi:carbamoyltransferase
MDLAASIQVVAEEIVLAMARELHRLSGKKNLVLAGGVALNCVANGRLLREGPFSELWIQPAAGDAGGALGAALFVWHQLLEKPRQTAPKDSQAGSFLGPRFSRSEIENALAAKGISGSRIQDEDALLMQIVEALSDGKVVGWFQGRMEYGPRALGARSILGDPRNPVMQSLMNLKIKYRESFRPFAPCVLRERAADYFAVPPETDSPYMLLVAPLLDQHRLPLSEAEQSTMNHDPDLRRRVKICRSTIPAVTHIDYTARIQTVDEQRHGRLYRLIKMFDNHTGCPMLVNTSFNVRGEPIVCTPEDAVRCFLATDMDLLVLEDIIVRKQEIKHLPTAAEKAAHLATFAPD